MSDPEDASAPPPAYTLRTASFRGRRLNPTIRKAVPGDAQTISAIRTYYVTETNLFLSDTAYDQQMAQKLMDDIQMNCKLPFLVATVPLAQLFADERMEAESSTSPEAAPAVSILLAGIASDSPSELSRNIRRILPDLPLSKQESKAKERIIGYVNAFPPQRSASIRAYWRTAECSMLVAPKYLGRGIGSDLMRSMIQSLESIVYVQPEARTSDLSAQIKSSSPRWLQLLAIVMVPRVPKKSEDAGERKMRHELDRQLDDQQLAIWTALGFSEKGRLIDIAEKHGLTRDVRYFQRHLKPVKRDDIIGVKQ